MPASVVALLAAVAVSPTVGETDSVFKVTTTGDYQVRQYRDQYRFALGGWNRDGCDEPATNVVGLTPPPRRRTPRRLSLMLAGPWCPGVWRGKVEFRDYRPRCRCYVRSRLGTFTVEVLTPGS